MFVKKFFGALILAAMLIFPQVVHANQSDWFAPNFDFRSIKSVIILDATINPELDYGGMIGLRGLQNNFFKSCREQLKPFVQVFSEDEARVVIGTKIGVNIERIYVEDPTQARLLIMSNAWRMADAYILGIVDSWGNKSYTAPSNVDYAKIIESRHYYDTRGNVRPDTVLVPVNEKYLPQDTDVPAIGMIFRAYFAQKEAVVFERYEMRVRKADESQIDLFKDMSASFASAVAAKIR